MWAARRGPEPSIHVSIASSSRRACGGTVLTQVTGPHGGGQTIVAAARNPGLDDQPEPFFYHDAERTGYVALLEQRGNQKKQRIVRLSNLAEAIQGMAGANDCWISQGEFFKPDRRIVHLSRMQVAFVDLDTYKAPRFVNIRIEAQLGQVLTFCYDKQIPEPSIVVFSGRGLQAKWLFSAPVPAAALPRWAAVQRALNRLLLDFGADLQAMDASRVLRLDGTISSRSGETIRVVHRAMTPTMGGQRLASGAVAYDFDELAETLLDLQRDELAAKDAEGTVRRAQDALAKANREAQRASLVLIPGGLEQCTGANPRPLVPSQLAWDRIADLRTLAKIRGHDGGLPRGQRNLFVFLSACFLAQAHLVRNLGPEIDALASEFSPDWTQSEIASCVSSVVTRAKAAARREKVLFNGLQVDARYRFSNTTLVEALEVTDSEALELKTILPAEEARRRNTQRHEVTRRQKGALMRDMYVDRASSRRGQAIELALAGVSRKSIATELGVSVSAVHGYLKR